MGSGADEDVADLGVDVEQREGLDGLDRLEPEGDLLPWDEVDGVEPVADDVA